MLITKIIKEWNVWRAVRRVVKSHKKQFWELNFDVDWLGRVYTVINIPDEIVDMPIKTQKDVIMQRMCVDNYIKDNLNGVTKLLNDLRLSDLVMYPDNYERFNNTDSILLILSPIRIYSKFWIVAAYFLGVSGIITFFSFLISYLIRIF